MVMGLFFCAKQPVVGILSESELEALRASEDADMSEDDASDVWWGETQCESELEAISGHGGIYYAKKKNLDNGETPTTSSLFEEFVKRHLVLLQLELLDYDSRAWDSLRADFQRWLDNDSGFMRQGPYAQFGFRAVFSKRSFDNNMTLLYGAHLALRCRTSHQITLTRTRRLSEHTFALSADSVTYSGDPLLGAEARDKWGKERKEAYVQAQKSNQKGVDFLNNNKHCGPCKLFVDTALQVYSQRFLEIGTPIYGTPQRCPTNRLFPN
jgi:hypothetical protein